VHTDLVKCLHLTEMTCKGGCVSTGEHESEIARVLNIDASEVVK